MPAAPARVGDAPLERRQNLPCDHVRCGGVQRVRRGRRNGRCDENIGWSLAIAEEHGFADIVVATDLGLAPHGCAMVRAWSDARCTAAGVDYRRVREDLIAGAFDLPDLRASPVAGWVPLEEREARIATATGTEPRESSFKVYLESALGGMTNSRPALPPLDLRTLALPEERGDGEFAAAVTGTAGPLRPQRERHEHFGCSRRRPQTNYIRYLFIIDMRLSIS